MKIIILEVVSLIHDFVECLLVGLLLGAIFSIGIILHDAADRPIPEFLIHYEEEIQMK